MGLITDLVLEAKGQASAAATWTGDGAYVFIDGDRVRGPEDGAADLPLQSDECYAIEIHTEDVAQTTINMAPLVRPVIRWRAVASAQAYLIYHTPPGGSESLIYRTPEDGSDPYAVRCPVNCAHGWHRFRVEARDSAGNTSTTTAWYTRAIDKPDIPSAIAASGSGGNITFTLTE